MVWGGAPRALFSAGALAAASPERAARAAQALIAALKPRELLLGRAGGPEAQALWHAAAAGAMAQGVQVLDAGEVSLPLLRHAQRLLGCDGAARVEEGRILPLNRLGARLLVRQQRQVAAALARQDFPASFSGRTRPILDAAGAARSYAARVASLFEADPAAPPVALFAGRTEVRALAEETLGRAGLSLRVEEIGRAHV